MSHICKVEYANFKVGTPARMRKKPVGMLVDCITNKAKSHNAVFNGGRKGVF